MNLMSSRWASAAAVLAGVSAAALTSGRGVGEVLLSSFGMVGLIAAVLWLAGWPSLTSRANNPPPS